VYLQTRSITVCKIKTIMASKRISKLARLWRPS